MLALLWAAAALLHVAAAQSSSCSCAAGFPPLLQGGYNTISGYAGCIINYIQFTNASGTVIFSSGTLSGGEPFSVTCPGTSTITGFSYLCNSAAGPNGDFPPPTFSSFSTIGGITCSNGSLPVYTGSLNENICELAGDYTQVGFLDCGADGSAPQNCFDENGMCVQQGQHAACAGTQTCNLQPSPSGPAGPWPMQGQNPQWTGQSLLLGPATMPTVQWSFPVADLYFAPAVNAEGYVFSGSTGGYFYCVNKSGALVWSTYVGSTGIGAPALSATAVFFSTQDARVFSFSHAGAPLWNVSLPGSTSELRNSPITLSSNGYLYFSGYMDYSTYCMSSTTGVIIWSFTTGGAVPDAPAVGYNGLVYVGSDDHYVYALQALTGQLAWKTEISGDAMQPVVGPDGTVYTSEWIGNQRVFALDGTTGAIKWVTANAGNGIILGNSGILYAGSDAWTGPTYSLTGLNASTGDIIWQTSLDSGAAVSVVDADNTLFLSQSGSWNAYSGFSGKQIWQMPGVGTSWLALGSDGALYGVGSGNLYSVA